MKLYISRILVITLVIGVFIFDLMTPLGHMEWIMHEAAVDVHETAFGIDQTTSAGVFWIVLSRAWLSRNASSALLRPDYIPD